MLLKRAFKLSFNESDFKLKESSFSSSSVTIISLSFNSDSFELKKKELNIKTSSLEKELWIEEKFESEENTVKRETCFSFDRR